MRSRGYIDKGGVTRVDGNVHFEIRSYGQRPAAVRGNSTLGGKVKAWLPVAVINRAVANSRHKFILHSKSALIVVAANACSGGGMEHGTIPHISSASRAFCSRQLHRTAYGQKIQEIETAEHCRDTTRQQQFATCRRNSVGLCRRRRQS